MSGAAFLRVEKLKGGGIIAVAARHNRREMQAEIGATGSIDPARTYLNFSLAGPATADAVAQLANDLMAAAGVVKLRKDAVRGIEVVFSLPVSITIDTKAYFSDCMAWAAAYFGGMENILSFDVHHDEAAPHAHALILPLANGRMDGSNLVGARSKLLAMQCQFHDRVAKRFGLRKAPAKMAGEAKHGAAAQVLAHLRRTGDSALQSLVWPTIRGLIEADPVPFMLALGLVAESAKKPIKPFVDYVTSKGRGPAREREERSLNPIGFTQQGSTPNPIGFAKQTVEKDEPYLCGGFANPTAPTTPSPVPQKEAPHRQSNAPQAQLVTEFTASSEQEVNNETRWHDEDNVAEHWCEELGEFIMEAPYPSTAPPRGARQDADTWTPTGGQDDSKALGTFHDGITSLDEFEQYDPPEVIATSDY